MRSSESSRRETRDKRKETYLLELLGSFLRPLIAVGMPFQGLKTMVGQYICMQQSNLPRRTIFR